MRDDRYVWIKSNGYYKSNGDNWKPEPLEWFKGKENYILQELIKVRKINWDIHVKSMEEVLLIKKYTGYVRKTTLTFTKISFVTNWCILSFKS